GELYLKKQYDQLIFDITVILKNSLKFQTIVPDNDSDNSEILIIWKRLAEMEQWYLIELKLINSILFVLPREIAYNAGLRILKEITKYNDFHYCTDLNLSILKNLSTLFLYYNNYEKCCYISSKLVDLALEKKRYDFLAVGLVRTGFCENDQTKIDKGMEILKITEDKIMFSYLSSELKKFKN
ncbi:XRE family transcriptional regulator, partial [Enterococcus faecalis]|nr:XRE family transcriptional regulator [Enterococcus faecalis]EKQ3714949.1 XRE family transcriptional regulator [Enterococcus faecalis]